MNWAPTVTLALVAALVFGWVARRFGLSPIVGYLLAGIAIGPHTPGFVGDAALASQLADVGVVLLMFGVGLSFSFADLWAVRAVAVPGALLASGLAVAGGTAVGLGLGWDLGAAMVLGMCLATASTVVIVRGLMELGLMGSSVGRIAIGWSVVEDLITVVLLVVLPALAPAAGEAGVAVASAPLWQTLLWTVGKVVLMAAVVIVGGGWLVPRVLAVVARSQSRELFTLAVLTVALGVAFLSAEVFGVSLALGAFFGGMVVGRSDLSHQAAADALPLRDAFAVLFFVAVGMLFDPGFVWERPLLVALALAIVLVGKPLVAVAFLLWAGHPPRAALSVGAAVAQVSEFSFVLAGLGVALGILPADGRNLVLAVALLSITASPLLFRGARPLERWLLGRPWLAALLARRAAGRTEPPPVPDSLAGHVVLAGFGRVGSLVGRFLERRGVPFVVVEMDRRRVEALRERGIEAVFGDAGSPILLDRAGVGRARALVLTMPDPVAQRLAIEHATAANPALAVLARTHSQAQIDELLRFPNVAPSDAEAELGYAMARRLLQVLGASPIEADATVLAAQGGAVATEQLRLFEVRVPATAAVVGRGIATLGLPASALIVAIVRGGQFLVARGPTALVGGDTLLLFANGDDARSIERLVAAPPEPAAAPVAEPDR